MLLGVAIFIGLAAFTARAVWRAFEDRSGQARAAAVFDLVATRTAVRPTNAPGAIAWLRRAVERAGFFDRSLADPSDAVPESLADLARILRSTEHIDGLPDTLTLTPQGAAIGSGSLRSQHLVHAHASTLVLTRRRALDGDSSSDRFMRTAAATLITKDAMLRLDGTSRVLPAVAGQKPARIVRIYAINEDGTLLSLPWVDRANEPAARDVVNRELAVLSTRPSLPAFAPAEFFFGSETETYSGFYLDLGGRGLVSTLTLPSGLPNAESRAVLAVDLAFDVDWAHLAESLQPPIRGVAAYVAPGAPTSWAAFAQGLGADVPRELQRALSEVPRLRPTTTPDDSPLRHAVVADGAIAAFQVSDRTWLLAWFPQVAPAFPVAAVSMLSVLLAVLLAGFEVNRRRALREQRVAEREFQEKQNLLNTMQVPLVVVDPNTDAIVSANRAADAVGFRAGRRFADLVWPDARARAHYQRMQVATPEPRRAYGVPIAITGEDGAQERRYAIVRSVAVTAPIEALKADERHRLGVLVVLDEAADLALLLEDVEAAAHRDERRRLASLLSHGVDTLARVLEYSLSRGLDPTLSTWLADYLERRVGVTAWLLDHWDSAPPFAQESAIDSAQARATVDRFQSVLVLVGAERELRQRLHWDNGTLSLPADRTLRVSIDWPGDVVVTCPVHGGFGLFLNELIVNAIRHGAPGSVPSLTISCDRARGELSCSIQNQTNTTSPALDHVDPYGGLSIVRAMARLFEWSELTVERRLSGQTASFVASWLMPFGTRRPGAAD